MILVCVQVTVFLLARFDILKFGDAGESGEAGAESGHDQPGCCSRSSALAMRARRGSGTSSKHRLFTTMRSSASKS